MNMRIQNFKTAKLVLGWFVLSCLWSCGICTPFLLLTKGHHLSKRGSILRILQQQQQSICSFDDLQSNLCSLEEYCQSLSTTTTTTTTTTSATTDDDNYNSSTSNGQGGITATCSGNRYGEWTIVIQLNELCYPLEIRENGFFPWNSNQQAIIPLPEFGFCSIESATFYFNQTNLIQSDHQEIITYPKDAKGIIQTTTTYIPCDDRVADTYFGQGYCASQCPQTKLQGSMQCNEECIICPSGNEVLNCSNIHSTLVEQCDNENAFLATLLAYLRVERYDVDGSSSSEEHLNSTSNNTLENNTEETTNLEEDAETTYTSEDKRNDGKQNIIEPVTSREGNDQIDHESSNLTTTIGGDIGLSNQQISSSRSIFRIDKLNLFHVMILILQAKV